MRCARGIAALVAVAMSGFPAAGAAAAGGPGGPFVAVEPSADLVDGQLVRVTGGGFSPGASVAVLECDQRATDQSGCDLGTMVFDRVGDDGTFGTRYTVDRTVSTDAFGDVDCASAPGACRLVAADVSDIAQRAAQPLAFDPDSPLAHPLRVELRVRRVGSVRDGRAVVEGTVACNHRADAFVAVTLFQQATPDDVEASGETEVVCGPEVAWRVTVPTGGGQFRPRNALAHVGVFAFSPHGDAHESDVVRIELRS